MTDDEKANAVIYFIPFGIVFPIVGMVAEIGLARYYEGPYDHWLTIICYVLVAATLLLYIFWLSTFVSQPRRQLLAIAITPIWVLLLSATVAYTVVYNKLDRKDCGRQKLRNGREICKREYIVLWDSWLLSVYSFFLLFALAEELVSWIPMIALPQIAAIVHSFLLGWYYVGDKFVSLYFILGSLAFVSLVYVHTTLVWAVMYRRILSNLLLPWSIVGLTILLSMSAGVVVYTIVYIEHFSAPSCSTYFCRSRAVVLGFSWVCWTVQLLATAVVASLLPQLQPPGLPVNIMVDVFSGRSGSLAIQAILHMAAIILQLTIYRDYIVSSPSLRTECLVLLVCTCVSLPIATVMTRNPGIFSTKIRAVSSWWHFIIMVIAFSFWATLSYGVTSYTLTWTRLPDSRCLARTNGGRSHCRLQIAAMAFSWLIWLINTIEAVYLIRWVASEQHRRLRLRQQWEDFRGNAPAVGGHIENGDASQPEEEPTPGGGHLKVVEAAAGGAGGAGSVTPFNALGVLARRLWSHRAGV